MKSRKRTSAGRNANKLYINGCKFAHNSRRIAMESTSQMNSDSASHDFNHKYLMNIMDVFYIPSSFLVWSERGSKYDDDLSIRSTFGLDKSQWLKKVWEKFLVRQVPLESRRFLSCCFKGEWSSSSTINIHQLSVMNWVISCSFLFIHSDKNVTLFSCGRWLEKVS